MEDIVSLETEFAPAERLPPFAVQSQSQTLNESTVVRSLLDAIPEVVVILNQQRQVIFYNKALVDTLGLTDKELIDGPRPGELLKCENAGRSQGGCGTTKYCRQCGAILAILASQKGEIREAECRINRQDTCTAFDLKVKAAPFKHNGSTYTIFSILDISDEKRREVLQHIFLHDILNTAGGLSGYSELLKMAEAGEDTVETREIIFNLTRKIISEINAQKMLMAAESGQLEPDFDTLNSLEITDSVASTYEHHEVMEGKNLIISATAESIDFESDRTLLSRVLGNLVKNALEASKKMGLVTIDVKRQKHLVVFSIHNQSLIPEEIQLQLFKRSFSTKGRGRGLGTYSVKLLTEKYLNGDVSFQSTEEEGTTFSVSLPID